ncbi:DUF3219 family protein [Paraliobacillus sediminis]|uniref:DUF3219 family protein n=1 Tax=Paraliobacillus sediminis TaxID=1885916 RepID=UPI000E3BC196|nr:DUF3219 family protein [Paraliobacillus sediminis]
MINELILDNRSITLVDYQQETTEKGRLKISVHFKVSHEEYHEITTLLYKGNFDVSVPEKKITFKGTIHNYSTSITNLYEKGNIGDFYLTLIEVK